MSAYPGNASLSTAVKDRVIATFQQTLGLYKQGRSAEVVAGCNLILQMDPLFDPAKKLLDKARNPALPIDVERLMPAGRNDALQQAREAMAARDFQQVINITTEILTNDLMNEEARLLSDQARERLEAAPFIEQFIRKCEQAVQSGNLASARTDLDKARALDPTHPELPRIARLINESEGTAAPVFDSSSFVVDTPSPSGASRGPAQAADFGFTFEEDKGAPAPAGDSFASFSFDSPAQPAQPGAGGFSFDKPTPQSAEAPFAGGFSFDTPAGASPRTDAGDFDFSTASIETSAEDQKKIEQYLTDGDRAFESGNYQQAIDLWSRIFLIDVTNEAASERIERAKGKRRELEQQSENVLASAIEAFERQDFDTARAGFNQVLQADPNNSAARDYLERIESGAEPAVAVPPSADFGPSVLDDDSAAESFGGALTPPEPAAIPAPAPKRAAAPKAAPAPAARKLPLGAIALVLALVVLGAGGWFVWTRFLSKPDAGPVTTPAAIDRASALGQQGQFDQAIALLQEIKPGDPQYDAALSMIADLQQKKARAATIVEGRPAAAFYEENLAAGRSAFAAHDYVGAKRAFENALRVKPLPPDVKASYDTAAEQVKKLETARTFFAERKYRDAISSLQPLLQQDPQNKNIQRMILDAQFNLGAMALREERLPEAVQAFNEVLKSDPNDELARRSKELAERYQGQPRDLLYRIYVKYLPLRQPAA